VAGCGKSVSLERVQANRLLIVLFCSVLYSVLSRTSQFCAVLKFAALHYTLQH
jgi:hypothetical protein